MKKIIIALALALTTTAIALPQAQAQTTYPDVKGLTAFAADCNYMSKAGYLRYRYFVQSGNWISYEEAYRQVAEQGG